MAEACFCVGDCETGGLDERCNPLLSVALVLGDADFNELDGITVKLLPPQDTWLEVPIRAHQTTGLKPGSHQIEYWLNVHTFQRSASKPKQSWLIGPAAVEKNNFVRITNNGWGLEAMIDWMQTSISLEQAEQDLIAWMAMRCTKAPIGVAHFAQFDVKFFQAFLPRLCLCFQQFDTQVRAKAEFRNGWYCTCEALKQWNKKSPTPGENAKLGALAKLAGYVPAAEHEALADARACLAGLKWLKTGKVSICQGSHYR